MEKLTNDLTNYLLSDSCVFKQCVVSEDELIYLKFYDGKFVNVDNIHCYLEKEIMTLSIFAKALLCRGSYDICGVNVALSKTNKGVLFIGDKFGWYYIELPSKFKSAIIKSMIM